MSRPDPALPWRMALDLFEDTVALLTERQGGT
jgi:hypothetical protein